MDEKLLLRMQIQSLKEELRLNQLQILRLEQIIQKYQEETTVQEKSETEKILLSYQKRQKFIEERISLLEWMAE